MSKFDSLDNTSPVLNDLRNSFRNCALSGHNLSYMKNMSLIPGAINVLDVHRMLPNETYKVNYDLLLQSMNPLPRPSLTRWKLYTHTFYSRDISLWKGANNFYTKGRKGDQVLLEPRIALQDMYCDAGTFVTDSGTPSNCRCYSTPNSLADQIGAPIVSYNPTEYADNSVENEFMSFMPCQVAKNGSLVTVDGKNIMNNVNTMDSSDDAPYVNEYGFRQSALPYVLYQKICIFNFYNANVLQSNKYIFPDDEDDLRLPYNCDGYWYKSNGTVSTQKNYSYVTHLNPLENKVSWSADTFDKYYGANAVDNWYCPSGHVTEDTTHVNMPLDLRALRFRQWKGDYFNTGCPFPELLRGDIPCLDDFVGKDVDSIVDTYVKTTNAGNGIDLVIDDYDGKLTGYTPGQNIKDAFGGLAHSVAKSTTLKAIKELEIATIFAQRFGLTDGSYNKMIEAQFGYDPHQYEHRPIYCGGSVQEVGFAESVGSDSANNGDRVCNANSLAYNNTVTVRSPDYGWCMTVCELVPEVQYSKQGVDRTLQAQNEEDIFWPINEKLGTDVIYNQEVCQNNGFHYQVWNRQPFAYTEKYAFMKSRRNTNSGFFALRFNGGTHYDARKLEYLQMVGQRDLDDAQLNNRWLTMTPENLQRSVMLQFGSKNILPFCLTVGINAHSISPLSSSNRPSGLGGVNV